LLSLLVAADSLVVAVIVSSCGRCLLRSPPFSRFLLFSLLVAVVVNCRGRVVLAVVIAVVFCFPRYLVPADPIFVTRVQNLCKKVCTKTSPDMVRVFLQTQWYLTTIVGQQVRIYFHKKKEERK